MLIDTQPDRILYEVFCNSISPSISELHYLVFSPSFFLFSMLLHVQFN